MTLETTTDATTYGERKTAARAARQALGADKISGVHFRIVDVADRFSWEVIAQEDAPPPPAPAPAASISDPEGGGTPNDDNAADLAAKAPKAKAAKAPKAPKVAKAPKAKAERKIADNGPGLPKGKLGQVIAMLQRPEGATNEQMQAATGWQAHTVRGAIAGAIKVKLGLAVSTEKTEAGTVYRIAA
jgi:uncharacterized protein DUF3489